jgi:hypothetical protein
VDPLAAERIVRYLRDLEPSQGLLFASHRIDECISTCNRVVMLVEGRVYFDGSVHAFDQLASLFYQVDLVLPSRMETSFSSFSSFPSFSALNGGLSASASPKRADSPLPSHVIDSACSEGHSTLPPSQPPHPSQSEAVVSEIALKCGGLHLFERVVEYSPTLVRLTFEKKVVPLTRVWNVLAELRKEGGVERYSFRTMGMEEALATIIASSKGL